MTPILAQVFAALAPSAFAAFFIIVMFGLIIYAGLWLSRRDRAVQQHRRSSEK